MNASISVINKQIDNCSIILTDSYKLVDHKKGISSHLLQIFPSTPVLETTTSDTHQWAQIEDVVNIFVQI